MIPVSVARNPLRIILILLLGLTTGLILLGELPLPPETAIVSTILLAVLVTDLLHEHSPDTYVPISTGDEPGFDTDTDTVLLRPTEEDEELDGATETEWY